MIRRICGLFLAFQLSVACGVQKSGETSSIKGLDTVKSNIASNSISLKDVKELKVLANTRVPKGVVVSYIGANYAHVKSLFSMIKHINNVEGLIDMEGYKQLITLLVGVRSQESFNDLKRRLYDDNVITRQEYESTYLAELQMAKGLIDQSDIWMQDWGEFVAIKADNPAQEWQYGIMDVGRGRGINPDVLSDIFKISFLEVSNGKNISKGNYGGNLEATPDDVLYFGNSLTDQSMRDSRLQRNLDAIELSSSWLNVGHVDEFITVIRSNNNTCGFALAVADPIRAINLYLKNPKDFASIKELKDLPSLEDWKILLANGLQKSEYLLSDFRRDYVESKLYDQLTTSGKFIATNIIAANIIQENLDKLQLGISCIDHDVAPLAQFYHGKPTIRAGIDFLSRGISTLQNTVNLVV